MELQLQRSVLSKYPDLRIGCILCTGINAAVNGDATHLLQEEERYRQLTTQTKQDIGYLHAPGKHYETSVQKLLRFVLQRRSFKGNAVTTVIRYCSLKHFAPIGADDIYKIDQKITWKLATKDTRLRTGTIYHEDNSGIIGKQFDSWQSGRTAVSTYTVGALVHIIALSPIDYATLQVIMRDVRGLVKEFCGGKSKQVILSKLNLQAKL